MTTHVFIVDKNTFKFHLEHLFAGTGAREFMIDFNNNSASNLHHSIERMSVGMTADACRIRKGDKILFYLQQSQDRHSKEPREGRFFGIFKAKTDWSFLDNNDGVQFLKNELNKSLTFRVEIEPDIVYPLGVTEWEALDEIKNVISPYQMIWSMIYRKLRGNRGNTMVTLYETERLIQLIRDKNERKTLSNLKQLSFDEEKQIIFEKDNAISFYEGERKEQINIFPRLLEKYRTNKKFEAHLQSYIVNCIGTGLNKNLDHIIFPKNSKIEWLGNEVGCGVGMQSIDILIEYSESSQRTVCPIELKCDEVPIYITNQLQRYIDWLIQYYKPNRQCDIAPILICKKHKDSENNRFENIIQKINDFNELNRKNCAPIKLIEFEILDGKITFFEHHYNSI